MTETRKQQIVTLLKGIETGNPESVAVVNPNQYIQHNPQTREGGEGLAALFKRLAQSSPRVNIQRIFADGDYVFAHTEYDFDVSRVGFEIFRFEGEQTVEHWDNIQRRAGPNCAGHSMVDGPTRVSDLDLTEVNREIVRAFVSEVLIQRQLDRLGQYIDAAVFVEHDPRSNANQTLLPGALTAGDEDAGLRYRQLHRLLADGNFVLAVSEALLDGIHSAVFDLFRVADGKLAEHWNTIEAVPPRSEWKNENGKF